MNFLIDVHLSISLSKFLDRQNNCSSVHVNQILQKWNTTDKDISNYADDNNLAVITKDNDFKNSHFISKSPQKIIRIALGNISNAELIELFAKYLPFILTLSTNKTFYIEISKEQLTIID
jgi:predicted nuclease of predicted toxin-antitoxin system